MKDRKEWNENLKKLRLMLKSETTFNQAIDLFMDLHAMVHSSEMLDIKTHTFEDDIWCEFSETAIRKGLNKKGRTVAYGMWHSARIEDITMNLLVADMEQVIDKGDWFKRINSDIYSTGNELDIDEILKFSEQIDIKNLKKYRNAVGIRTREIVSELSYKDTKRKVSKAGLDNTVEKGAVAKSDKALWLIDFWGKKTVAGILLMPATRHNLVHINESIEAKKRGLKLR